MKTIMIIGAGMVQVPLIEAAVKEHYHTIVCDIDPNAPGVLLADEYFKVSTKDRNALFNVARKKHIDGVIANSEYAMCDVAYIAEHLGLVGNSEKAISIFSTKSKFRELQKNAGLFAPVYLHGAAIEKLNEGFLKFPVIIKPDQCSGQRGSMIVEDTEDYETIKSCVSVCKELSGNGSAIAEEYVQGSMASAIEGEVFIHNGEILWDGLFLSLRSKMAPMIPMTYVFPLPVSEKKIKLLKGVISKAFCAANVVHGEYNMEMFFSDKEEPFIIEINPRQGGNDLPKYVQEHCGIDYNRLLVTTAMENDDYWDSLKQFRRNNNHIVHHMLYPRKKGRFKGLGIDQSVLNYIYSSKIDVKIGDEIDNTVDASSCIGYVDLAFSDFEKQMRVSSSIEELIQIDIT